MPLTCMSLGDWVSVCVCTRLNVGLELNGHSLVCSLNLLHHQTPPSPTFPSLVLFSVLQLINPPDTNLPTLPFSSNCYQHASLICLHESPPTPPTFDWIGSVQVGLSGETDSPQIRPTISTWKGTASKEQRVLHACACVYVLVGYGFVHMSACLLVLSAYSCLSGLVSEEGG